MKKYCAWLTSGIGDKLHMLEHALNNNDINDIDFYWVKSRLFSMYDPYQFFEIDLPLIIVEEKDARKKKEEVFSLYPADNIFNKKGEWKTRPPLFSKYIRIKKSVTQLVDDMELSNSIGLHLRSYNAPLVFNNKEITRGKELDDILIAGAEAKMSKYENYFIASDSKYILDHFKDFKNVVTIPSQFDETGYSNKLNDQSFYFDLCNLYALSRCKMIYSTIGGFSRLASVWGSIPTKKLIEGFTRKT